MPALADRPQLRVINWRNSYRFPKLAAAWRPLAEILERTLEGSPRVSEAEFAELADWFRTNDRRLYGLSLPSQLLDVGGGRQTTTVNVRCGLIRGFRAPGAGELAEDLRRLRARYGDEVARACAPA